jgi:hypothetical protein
VLLSTQASLPRDMTFSKTTNSIKEGAQKKKMITAIQPLDKQRINAHKVIDRKKQ